MHRRNNRFSVVVSDRTRMNCDLLAHALNHIPDLNVVGTAATVAALAEVVENHNPNITVVSLDLEDGPGSGLAALEGLRQRYPSMPCVALIDDASSVISAFRAGARGVVFRTEPVTRLVESLRSVHAGNVWASFSCMDLLMNAFTAPNHVHVVSALGKELLTNRQQSIVALVAEGLSNREIAQQLSISEHTVKNYLFRIFDRLGVSSRAELIIYTLQRREV